MGTAHTLSRLRYFPLRDRHDALSRTAFIAVYRGTTNSKLGDAVEAAKNDLESPLPRLRKTKTNPGF